MRVLLVDEDRNSREELGEILLRLGHTPVGVTTPATAISSLEAEEFDLMFVDVRAGRRGGVDLLERAKSRWPRLIVVMLTANASVESAVQTLQLGALDYLRKPVTASQVERALLLVNEQLALTRTGGTRLDPGRCATALAEEGGYEVLLIAPPPVHVVTPRIRHVPLEPDSPARIRSEVEAFVRPRDRAAVVLAAVEELLARHREEEIAALLEAIREILRGKGPLAVGYDPDKISATGALAVRASIVSADAHTTLESLANPVRRMVLHRLSEGPCTFTQAMEAAHIDDTSLIAFHLRKLTESGLVAHSPRERYRLTARGKGAIQILTSIDELDASGGSGNRVFASMPPTPGPTSLGR